MKINKKSVILTIIFSLIALTLIVVFIKKHQQNTMLKEAKKVFEDMVELTNSFDPSALSLYSDDAKNIVARFDVITGVSSPIEISISHVKPIADRIMQEARKNNDTSIYSNIKYLIEKDQIKVTATRYSTYKCFTDKDYYAIIKKIEESYKITKEYAVSSIRSNCEVIKENLEEVLKKRAEVTKGLAPFQLDEYTWLDNATADKKVLTQELRVMDSLGLKEINGNFKKNYLEVSCNSADPKHILDLGGEIRVIFKNESGNNLGEVYFSKESCKF